MVSCMELFLETFGKWQVLETQNKRQRSWEARNRKARVHISVNGNNDMLIHIKELTTVSEV